MPIERFICVTAASSKIRNNRFAIGVRMALD